MNKVFLFVVILVFLSCGNKTRETMTNKRMDSILRYKNFSLLELKGNYELGEDTESYPYVEAFYDSSDLKKLLFNISKENKVPIFFNRGQSGILFNQETYKSEEGNSIRYTFYFKNKIKIFILTQKEVGDNFYFKEFQEETLENNKILKIIKYYPDKISVLHAENMSFEKLDKLKNKTSPDIIWEYIYMLEDNILILNRRHYYAGDNEVILKDQQCYNLDLNSYSWLQFIHNYNLTNCNFK